MSVKVSADEMKLFDDNGISEEQIRNTVNIYRQDGLSDDEIRGKIDTKLSSFQKSSPKNNVSQVNSNQQISNNINDNQNNEVLTPENGVLQGGISTDVQTYWDKKGKIHYVNEEEQPKMNWFKRQGRKIKAGLYNAQSWINESDPNSQRYKDKTNLALAIITAPFGMGKTATQWGAAKLTPFLGKKIATTTAQGIGGGLVSGGVEGLGRGFIEEDKNPVVEGIKGALLGGAFGGGLGAIGGKIGQKIAGNKLKKLLEAGEKDDFKKAVNKYYRDYEQGRKVTNNKIGEIKLSSGGMKETNNQNLKKSEEVIDLSKNLNNAKYKHTEDPKHPHSKYEIQKFHRLRNGNNDYLIAENKKGNNYFHKITDLNLTDPKSEGQGLNNIINDNVQNFNPAKTTIGAEIPETTTINNKYPYKPKEHIYKKDLEKALGLTENNWDQEPNFYSKEKEDEAFAILSKATGKSSKWLRTQLKGGNGRGMAKRREFIELLLEHTDDKLNDIGGTTKYYDSNALSYEAKDSTSDQLGKGQELAERVYNDIMNKNFDLDPLTRDIDTATIEYKKIMRELLDSEGTEESYVTAQNKLEKAIGGLPKEYQESIWGNFWDDAEKVENVHISNKMRANGDLKQSKLAKTADLPDDMKKAMQNTPPEYDVLHNKDLIENAKNEISKDFNGRKVRIEDMADKENPMSAQDFEEARQLVSQLYSEGRIDEALKLTEKVSQAGSRAGQSVQAMSLWAKTTPEGAVRQAQKIIDEYNKTARKKIPNLTEEQAKTIIEMAEEIQRLGGNVNLENREQDVATAKLMKYLGELVPQSAGNKLKSLRNISLLLNGKTFMRNITGNAIFSAMENGVTKPIAAGVDKIASLFTGNRTRVLPQLGEYGKGLVQGFKEGAEDVKLGIDTRKGIGQRFDLPQRRSFDNPVMGGSETALDFSLRVPDRSFYQATFNESLANQMRAAGVEKPTEKMLENANLEALESVYQNNGKLASLVSGLRKGLNNFGIKDFGFGDALIPYAQTPANVAQQGINYSPLGVINAIKSGLQGNQRQATLDLARTITGTGLIGTGYIGAKNGMFTDNFEDYKTKKNYEALGIRPNQINLPNGSVMSYSQLQPLAAPLSSGAVLADLKDGNFMQAMDKGLGTLADLGMLRGITDFISDYNDKGIASAVANTITSIPSQFIGTGINQLNTYIDPYQRETYDPNPLIQGLNQARAKVPILSYTLPKKYDVTGREIKKYEGKGVISKAYDNFVNPVFINKPKDDIVMQEVMALYEVTGEKGGLLNVPEKKIKLDNGTYKQLSNKEFSQYSKRLGEETYSGYQKMMNTNRYLNADDNTRLKLLGSVKDNAKAIVQQELFGKTNKYSSKNAINRKIENKLNRGQNKMNSLFNKIDKQLVEQIMYEEE